MRSLISMACALGLSFCALVACSPQDGSAPAANRAGTMANGNSSTAQTTKQAPTQPAANDARRISLAETQAAIAAGKVVIVDVRDEGAYKASHIKGAKLIPLAQVEQRAGELPKDKLIITYCA